MSDKLVTTPSGLIVPKSAAEAAQRETLAALHNEFILYPHAREYMPGQPKFTGDKRVADLNRELAALCENMQTGSKLFAAYHEENQKLRSSGMFGVVLWSVDSRGNGRAVGNPNVKSTGGKALVGVVEPIYKIIEFYHGMLSMNWSDEDKGALMKRWEDLMGRTEVDRKREEKTAADDAAAKDRVLTQIFEDVPTRADRTIPETRGRKKRVVTTEVADSGTEG